MVTDILLEQQPVPSTGALTLQVTVEIAVSAETAQRRVNHFVHMEISTQMHAETPVLVLRQSPGRADEQNAVVGAQAVWRVPVHLTFPTFGDAGYVGFVHVDPVTGELDVSQAVIEEIERNAQNLVERLAPLSRTATVASPEKPQDQIVIRAVRRVRHNWEEQFQAMAEKGDDKLLGGDVFVPTAWDEEEWEW